jgi:GPH family glycoside/pentoside/hexuronide:cation symporter
MVSLSTRNTNKRGVLATMSNAALVAVAGIGASILVPVLLQSYMFVYNGRELDIAASYSHWRRMAIVLSIVTAAGILTEFFFTRERITEETMEQPEEEVIPAARYREACFRSPYWWMVMLYVLFFLTGQLIKNTSMSFYSRWMFESALWAEDPEQASGALMSALGLIGGLPAALGMFIVWPLANKFGKQRIIVTGLILSLAGGSVAFLGVHDFKIVCAGVALKAIGIVPSQFILLALISDVLDHLEAENGFRSDGFTMSVYSAIMVGLLGLAVGIVSGLLGLAGYDASLVRQPAAVENVLIFAYLGLDLIAFTVSIILLWKMDVEYYIEGGRCRTRKINNK